MNDMPPQEVRDEMAAEGGARPAREMRLDEWMATLPVCHAAYREYIALKADRDTLAEALRAMLYITHAEDPSVQARVTAIANAHIAISTVEDTP